jgi:hypothetical protein
MALSLSAMAEGQRARLTVNVSVDGTESVTDAGNNTQGRFHESFQLVTYLKSSGDPSEINTKDPNYAQNMMAQAAAVQQKVREVQQKQGKNVPRMTPEQLAQYMQKKQAECKGDQSCMMKLAMEASELSANMAIGENEGGVAPAQLPAEDSEPELRYQTYVGYDNCGASTRVKVDSVTTGVLADVAGPEKYTITQKADYSGDALELRLICNAQNYVFDTRTSTVFTDGAVIPQAKGVRNENINGRISESKGDLPMHGEAMSWVSQQLRQAPASGEKSTTLKLGMQAQSNAVHSGVYKGEARIKMSWIFEPKVD